MPLLLVGCSSNIEIPKFNAINNSTFPKYNFDASKVVINFNQAASHSNDISNEAPVSLESSLRSWVNSNISADNYNSPYYLKLSVIDAFITEKKLPSSTSWKNKLGRPQDVEYKAKLAVNFELYEVNNVIPIAEMKVSVKGEQTLNSGDSLADKQKLLDELVRKMFKDFVKITDNNIYNYLGKFLR